MLACSDASTPDAARAADPAPGLDAESCLRRAAELERSGQFARAAGLLRRLARGERGAFAARLNLGALFLQRGRARRAVAVFETCVALRPCDGTAHANLAAARLSAGDPGGACQAAQRAVEWQPESWAAHYNLGAALEALGDDAPAARAFRRAARFEPAGARALHALGALLLRRGRARAALAVCDRAVRRQPDMHEAQHTRAVCLQELGYERRAAAAFRRAIALRPDGWRSRCNLGLLLLKRGRWDEGFREFEWRFQSGGQPAPRWGRPQPVWRGEPLAGRRLLLCAEQGFGDQIQFVRFARQVQRLGASVWIEAASNLAGLLATCPWIERVIACDTPCPEADFQLPLLSLPARLGFDAHALAGPVPYLHPPTGVSAEVEHALAAGGDRLRVGVVWTGDPRNPLNVARSCTPRDLAPLTAVPGVCLLSLQHRDAGLPSAELEGCGLRPLGALLGDFVHTASVVRRCDLVITVDTVMAHLAGALGQRVWTLLPRRCDWRWMTGRDDSPWYPSMRLFRQGPGAGWRQVVERIVAELRRFAAERAVRG